MRGSVMPLLIGAKHRSRLFPVRNTRLKHKRDVHLDKLRPFEIGYTPKKNIYIDAEDSQKIEALLVGMGVDKDDKLIGINPWSRSLLKRWDMQYLIDSIKEILKEKNVKVILMGDAVESGLSKEIVDSLKDPKVIDLTGKTNLNELFALIERMSLLLTCDSAAMHIACDLGIRVIAIFGPTDPLEYGPKGENDIVIRRKDLKCSPCKKAVCRFNHECMKGIKPEEVIKAVKKCFGKR
jgi:ADP-heptose:LPS heptosyltransferase